MARILITGFCAVPGPTRSGVQLRQVVRALSALGMDTLRAVDRREVPPGLRLPSVDYRAVDVRDAGALAAACEGMEAVVHAFMNRWCIGSKASQLGLS